MKANIANVIAEFVRQSDSDLDVRLESQAQALIETHCVQPIIGKWIDANDAESLLGAFALADKDFADKFPALAHVTARERHQCIKAIEVHFEHCQHCSLKRGYDLEMDSRIEQAYRQNKNSLLQLLRENDSESSDEGDHILVMTAIPAHQ